MPAPLVVRVIARLNIGGPAIHTVLVTAGLDRARFRSMLVTGRPGEREGDMSYFATERGVEPVVIPELGREISALDDLRAFVRLVRILRRERPAIVHTHTAKAGTLGRLAAIVAGVPVRVHTFHGHVFEGYFAPWKTQFFLAIERLLARRTHRILAISEAQRSDLVERFRVTAADRVTVVPLGLDLAPFAKVEALRGQLRAELGIGLATKLVGIVGRLVPIKQHELFLEAASRLAKSHAAEVRFLVIGGGERQAELERFAASLGIADRVSFLGWRRDLDRIYADLDLLALTSKNEGTPVAIIEAMAAGVPIAATAVGGVADLLRGGERGELIAPPFSADAVAAALARALLPAARARAELYRAAVAAEYGAERLCADLERLYASLLGTDD